MVAGLGCGDRRASKHEVIATVEGEPLHAVVVEHVATREGISHEEAQRYASDVLRLVAAARMERGTDELAELSSPHRVAHLERAARARLWLETDFEPRHRAADIPADHALLASARASTRLIHPRVHVVCQVIAMPPEDLDAQSREAKASDPSWRARAQSVLDPAADRLRRHLPEGDAEPCKLVRQWIAFEQSSDESVRLRVEAGGFDLEACQGPRTDGRCETPQFSPRWTEPVSRAEGPGFLPPFFTEFGLHLVYVVDILPARSLDDPDTDTVLREQVHEAWQRERFAAYVQRLREKRAIRIAPPSALEEPGAEP